MSHAHAKRYLIGAMFLAFFVVVANIIIIAPLLPFITRSLAISERASALLLVAFPLTAFTVNLLVGPFIDHYGRQRMIVIGAFGCALSFAVAALATGAIPLIATRVSTGLFAPLIGASVFACVADFLEGDERVKAMGYVTVAGSVAQLTVPPLGVLVGEQWTWRAAFVALAVSSLAVAACTSFMPQSLVRVAKSITPATYAGTFASIARCRALLGAGLAYMFAVSGVLTIQGLYATRLVRAGVGSDHVAALFFAAGAAGVFAASRAGSVAARFPDRPRLIAGLLGACAACAASIGIFRPNFVAQFIPYVTLGASMAVVIPVVRASMNDLVNQSERGTLNGLWNAVYQLGSGLGATASALFFAADSSYFLNSTAAALLFLIAAALFRFRVGPRSGGGETTKSADPAPN